jgi:hypothetical protein
MSANNYGNLIRQKTQEFVQAVRLHLVSISSETLGWIAISLIHLATIPTLIAILTGLTDNTPPADLVLAMWAALTLFFIKATLNKDMLTILTIGLGFVVQAALMALILFR